MEVLDIIFYVALAAGILSAPAVLFSIPYLISDTKNGSRITSIGLIVFIVSVATGMAAASTSCGIGHREVLRKLESLDPESHITIDGQEVRNTKEILGVLKAIDWLPYHHSHPTKRISVSVSDHAPRLELSLARDSSNPQEYWIYWPKYHVTAQNDIGRIRTTLFDSY